MKIKMIAPVVGRPASYFEEKLSYLQEYLDRDVVVEHEAVLRGFPSIETEAQGIINGAEVLKRVKAVQNGGYDGIFVDCFDDPAVTGAREISEIPVLGPYFASLQFASLLSDCVGILTTDRAGILCEERKARANGISRLVRSVKPIDLTVLALRGAGLSTRIADICQEFEEEGNTVVVLGCTGMFADAVQAQEELKNRGSHVQIVEPLRTGMTALVHLIRLGHTNTIRGTAVDFALLR